MTLAITPYESKNLPPVSASENVELAVLREKVRAFEAAEGIDNASGWESEVNFLRAQLDKLRPAGSTVERTIIHRRCWGSWTLALIVAAKLASDNRELVASWLAWARGWVYLYTGLWVG